MTSLSICAAVAACLHTGIACTAKHSTLDYAIPNILSGKMTVAQAIPPGSYVADVDQFMVNLVQAEVDMLRCELERRRKRE